MPQPPQAPQPPPAATLIKPDYKDLTDNEQAQVLQSAGVQPDMMGRALERREMMREDAMEEGKQAHEEKMDVATLLMEMQNAKAKEQNDKAKISASNRKPRNPKPE